MCTHGATDAPQESAGQATLLFHLWPGVLHAQFCHSQESLAYHPHTKHPTCILHRNMGLKVKTLFFLSPVLTYKLVLAPNNFAHPIKKKEGTEIFLTLANWPQQVFCALQVKKSPSGACFPCFYCWESKWSSKGKVRPLAPRTTSPEILSLESPSPEFTSSRNH